MNFYSIRELRTETKNIYENILQNGEAVITNNGKPSMLMINISEDNFDELHSDYEERIKDIVSTLIISGDL